MNASNGFNGWDFGSTEIRAKVKYIAVMRGDLDLTNAYGLASDEALAEFLRDAAGDSRLYGVFEVVRVAPDEPINAGHNPSGLLG